MLIDIPEHKKVKTKIQERIENQKDFIIVSPPEVIIYNIEKNKVYEIPVKLQNNSDVSRYINVKLPEKGYFKIEVDRKVKMFKVPPGLYIEIIVIFECHELGNFVDTMEICSENGQKIKYLMKALVAKEAIIFEPFINLGLVPVNTEKVEYIEFINEGTLEIEVELKSERQLHPDIIVQPDKFHLSKKINEKEFNELYYMQNKDEKERQKLKELIHDKARARHRVKITFV